MFRFPRRIDYSFGITVGLLVLFGLVALASAGAVVGFQKYHDTYFYLKHQFVYGILPGIVVWYVFLVVPMEWWKKLTPYLFGVSLFLLVVVLFPQVSSGTQATAKSWIIFAGMSFQPSELMKLGMILFLARWLSKLDKKDVISWNNGALPFIIIVGVIAVLLVLEPDLGTLILTIAIAFGMYYIAGARYLHLILFSGAGVLAIVVMVALAPYRLNRLTVFLDPSHDPQGSGYHLRQAMIAIGSGGVFGLGFGHSRQKFAYLPEVVGDSLFAVIAEELGFILTTVVVGLWLMLIFKGMRIAQSAATAFEKYAVCGIMLWFFFQFFFNIGAMIGILPLTGLPLPFMSYGGSAMAMALAAVGFVMNVSVGQRRV